MQTERKAADGVNPSLGAAEWGWLVVLSVLWGGSFFFVGVAVHELPPLTIVLARVGIAALALLALGALLGVALPRSPRRWGEFLVMGALNGLIPYSLIVWGQGRIDSGVAAILNGTTPLFSVLLVPCFTRDERLTALRLTGVLLGLAGLATMVGVQSLRGLGSQVWGQAAVVGAALSYAFAAIYGRRFRGTPALQAAIGQTIGTTLLALPPALVLERPWQLHPSPAAWASLLGLALLSTALGYLLYFRILRTAGATNLLLVTLLIPVSALALGMLVLHEHPHWSAFAGMALIFAGIAAVDGRALRWLRSAPRPAAVQAPSA
jgi:drug/metabolite transporter (DMT)-like permease